MYTNEEKLDIILIYGECRRNALRVWQLYIERYPDRNIIDNIYWKLLANGSWNATKRHHSKPVTHEANEVAVLAFITNDPHTSIRQISRGSGISCSSVIRILHRHKFHLYHHLSLHQEQHGNDFNARVEFCEFAVHQLQNNNDFFRNFCTDEASFTNDGEVNLRNMYY
jgi:hypothetical protein